MSESTSGSVPASPLNATRMVAHDSLDLVAMAPLMLGFHPADSVVMLTFGAPGRTFHARVDLPADEAGQEAVTRTLVGAATTHRVERVALLLYSGDREAVDAQALLLVGTLLFHDVSVVDVLRVHEGRWYPVPEEGDPGTPYDLDTHRFTAQRVYDGHQVLEGRESVAALVAANHDIDTVQIANAAERYARTVETNCAAEGRAAFLRAEARWVQRTIRRTLRKGGQLRPAEAGRLLLLMNVVEVRDVAWAEMNHGNAEVHARLWCELVRRCPEGLIPGPAALAGFAAWLAGEGALSWCALDRCLAVDPGYSMADCVAGLLLRAVSPWVWVQLTEAELPVFAKSA